RLLFSDESYLHTVLAVSRFKEHHESYFLERNYQVQQEDVNTIKNRRYNLTTSYTNKVNANHTLRAGLILSYRNFEHRSEELNGYPDPENRWGFFGVDKGTTLLQSFVHWKYRINNRWTINSGLRGSYFRLNNSYSIEPRIATEWAINDQQQITASAGLYSELPHEAFYFVEGITAQGDSIFTSPELKMTKSLHLIGGYQIRFTNHTRLKAEVYYQHIYDVPVIRNFDRIYSSVNAADVWALLGPFDWANEGTARNYGIDLTLERFFSKKYYFLLTGSLFRSRFTPFNGQEYSTRYDSNFRLNLLGGKEFALGKDGNKTLGINGRFVMEGGKRITPIDLERSKEFGITYRDPANILSSKLPMYYRFDLGLSYQINHKSKTHTWSLNIQNLTNRENAFDQFYNENTESIVTVYHRGFIPALNYRLDF
ncbi:MAG: TonB-dependent receptor, partial [Bacteroidota bacterium]